MIFKPSLFLLPVFCRLHKNDYFYLMYLCFFGDVRRSCPNGGANRTGKRKAKKTRFFPGKSMKTLSWMEQKGGKLVRLLMRFDGNGDWRRERPIRIMTAEI